MEYLDYYDEDGNYLGFKTSEEIHAEGLWHNIIHFWLYDSEGNVYFQIDSDSNKFFTTSSGHILKGEKSEEALKRIVLEDIGIEVDCSDENLADVIPFITDKTLSDGSIWLDRVNVNIYIDLYKGDMRNFHFDNNKVSGIVRVNAVETLEIFENKSGTTIATIAMQDDSGNINITEREVTVDEFLVNSDETAFGKYGDILNKLIEEIY